MVNSPIVCRFFMALVLTVLAATAAKADDVRNGFDVSDALVPTGQIFWGGVPRDGIPAIDEPNFVSPDKAKFLRDWDRVLGVFHNGIAKAYPIKIMNLMARRSL